MIDPNKFEQLSEEQLKEFDKAAGGFAYYIVWEWCDKCPTIQGPFTHSTPPDGPNPIDCPWCGGENCYHIDYQKRGF